MTEFQYKKAPITEAIVEFRSATPVDEKKRQKALKKLNKIYADHNPVTQQDIKFEVSPKGEPKIQTTNSILDKFSSDDMTQQLHITDISFLISQLAPYVGWEQYKQRIMRDWDTWRKVVNFQPVERVGMRYINRIDLPVKESIVRYEDYVSVYPTLPTLLDPTLQHSVNVKVLLDDIQSILNLKSAIVESPLPDHLAIVIDLDIVRRYQEPPNDEELYSFISLARNKKNEIFEACIKDKARELFS
jgi:uncharacterized protein (TIGR04255 family)